MKKNLYQFFFFIVLLTNGVFGQTKVEDINGLWQSTKPGAELFIEIKGTKATITSVGQTKLTRNVEGGYLYESISFANNGTWSAQRNAWKYNGVGGQNSENGRWEKAEYLTLSLSADKNTLSASGHWTYKRVGKIIQKTGSEKSSDSRKYTFTEDFNGVSGKFQLIDKPNGGDFVLAQFSNNTSNKLAVIKIKTDDGNIVGEYLYPGEGITKKYDSEKIDIQVYYQDSNQPKKEFNLIDFTKEAVRKQVAKQPDGKIIFIPMTTLGVRG